VNKVSDPEPIKEHWS